MLCYFHSTLRHFHCYFLLNPAELYGCYILWIEHLGTTNTGTVECCRTELVNPPIQRPSNLDRPFDPIIIRLTLFFTAYSVAIFFSFFPSASNITLFTLTPDFAKFCIFFSDSSADYFLAFLNAFTIEIFPYLTCKGLLSSCKCINSFAELYL